MSEPNDVSTPEETFEALKARANALERQLQETESQSLLRLRQFELKAEALRAGIVDLDGLRLLDTGDGAGWGSDSPSPADVINKLRRDKPWLFTASSSSSTGSAPAVVVAKRKLATEMTVEEWRAARADMLRRR